MTAPMREALEAILNTLYSIGATLIIVAAFLVNASISATLLAAFVAELVWLFVILLFHTLIPPIGKTRLNEKKTEFNY